MTKRIDYSKTVDATSTEAKDTIDSLATERENGNITDYAVDFRADASAIEVHVWRDVDTIDGLPDGYDAVDAAIANTPVTLPDAASNAPVHNR